MQEELGSQPLTIDNIVRFIKRIDAKHGTPVAHVSVQHIHAIVYDIV